MQSFENVKLTIRKESKIFGIPQEMLPFLADAFDTKVQEHNGSRWVAIVLNPSKEVTFFGN